MKHTDYVLHYENLKQVISLGAIVTKVSRVISFNQSQWLKVYIDKNTSLRANPQNNKFEKDFYKLMNNAVFGKTMENVRNEIDIKLTTDESTAVNYFSKINFANSKETNGLYSIHMNRIKRIYDKPIYVGACILDLSKVCMIDFHYKYMMNKYGDNLDLIYSDTDSLVYNVYTEDWYDDVLKNKEHFDLSEMKDEHMRDNTNCKVVGKFKDEEQGNIIKEWCATGPKSHAHSVDNVEHKKCKGVAKSYVDKDMKLNDYTDIVYSGKKKISDAITCIRSYDHRLFSIEMKKVSLSSFYDKMQMTDANTCYPFGYKM